MRHKLSWFGHVCHHHTLPKIILREHQMGVIAEDHASRGRTISKNGQTRHCRRCCALQATEVEGRPSQQMRLLEYPHDALASREFS